MISLLFLLLSERQPNQSAGLTARPILAQDHTENTLLTFVIIMCCLVHGCISAFSSHLGTLKPTEKQLMLELHNTVASNWRAIGTFLEIPAGELNTIAERERGNPQRCLMEMLGVWLRRVSPAASWTDIADAVEIIGRPDIAQQIRQKYCKLAATFADI